MIGELIVLLQWLISFIPYWHITPANCMNVVHYSLPFRTIVRQSKSSGFTWDLFIHIEQFEMNEQPFVSGNIRATTSDRIPVIFELHGVYKWVNPVDAVMRFGYDEAEDVVTTYLTAEARKVVSSTKYSELSHASVTDHLEDFAWDEFDGILEVTRMDVGGFARLAPKQLILEGTLQNK